jgi:putative two-component system response regulator
VFDALTSERPYKKAFPIEKAMEIMRDGKGSFFDPDLLDLFTKNPDAFISIKEAFRDVIDPSFDNDSAGGGI